MLYHLLKSTLHSKANACNSEYLLFCVTICIGPKKQGFWLRINCSQMKLPDFESTSGDSSSKRGNFGLSK